MAVVDVLSDLPMGPNLKRSRKLYVFVLVALKSRKDCENTTMFFCIEVSQNQYSCVRKLHALRARNLGAHKQIEASEVLYTAYSCSTQNPEPRPQDPMSS